VRAIVQRAYGGPEVLRLVEVERPAVGREEVGVRVRAASTNAGDYALLTGLPYINRLVARGLRAPRQRIPGYDLAGVVETVGEDVQGLRPGDAVVGSCAGAFAEFVSGPAERFVPKPAGVPFAQAAATPASGLVALQGLRDGGRLATGQRVLVQGASGGVGTFAVQVAKVLGAHVTGVCSTRNLALVREIGADAVIDYTREDFADGSQHYDLLFDVAAKRSLGDCRKALTPRGTYILVGNAGGGRWLGGLRAYAKALLLSPWVSQRLRPFIAAYDRADLATLSDWTARGMLRPVVDRTYPLAEAAQALDYIGQGHARAKVVLQV
jgi:NADPH:quinone reductase-like Zn-dependent oxidoreductase